MNMMEKYSQQWIQTLERRKTGYSYSFVWYLLVLSCAFIFFGLIDKVWFYYLEGALVGGVAVVLFVIETCWRRIMELKRFLSEYANADRTPVSESAPPKTFSPSETEPEGTRSIEVP